MFYVFKKTHVIICEINNIVYFMNNISNNLILLVIAYEKKYSTKTPISKFLV